MKTITKIWLFLLFLPLIGCRTRGNEPQKPDEGVVTARIISYNEAKLTGDVWRRMQVIFDNSSHSGGRISAGNTAVLTLRGIPDGWITNVTLWMRSNKTSGAGSISVILGDTIIMSKSGTYADWVGHYSDTNLPISTYRQSWKNEGQDIVLTIVGEENSLYLDRMEISYSKYQPVYPPEEPDTTCVRLVQDTTFVSGEYALVCNLDTQYLAAKGGWISGKYLTMDSIMVSENEDGMAECKMKEWPADMRYKLTFDGDSVIIHHPYTQEYIGYNATSASKKCNRWAWKKAANGSVYIYHDMTWHEGKIEVLNYWQAYSFYPWLMDDQIVAYYMQIIWKESTTYWKLMRLE